MNAEFGGNTVNRDAMNIPADRALDALKERIRHKQPTQPRDSPGIAPVKERIVWTHR